MPDSQHRSSRAEQRRQAVKGPPASSAPDTVGGAPPPTGPARDARRRAATRTSRTPAGTDDIRRWAAALPEVEEASHFRFHVPVFKVGGRTFVGLGKDETTAVFCVSEQDADSVATTDPDSCAAVRRRDARKSFLGLEVKLGEVDAERIRDLVERAWRRQAPKKLVAQHDRDASPS